MAIRYLAESGLRALIKAIKAAIAEASKTAVASSVTFEDGETFQDKLDAGKLTGPAGKNGEAGAAGPKGDTGPAPKITVQTAETVATPGIPSVTATQDGANVTLTFDKLKGDKGDTGAPGGTGPAGPAGPAGAAGPNKVTNTTTTDLTGLLKGDGKVVSAAKAGTDFVAPTGSITGSSGSCTGNAATATKLAADHKVNGVVFNGTADITSGTLPGVSTLKGGDDFKEYIATQANIHKTSADSELNYYRVFPSDEEPRKTADVPSGDQHVLAFSIDKTSANWIRLLALDVRSNRVYVRARTNGATWTGWAELVSTQFGKATDAAAADKVKNKLTFSGGSTASFDGSGAVTVPIPKVQQVSVTIPASGWKTDDADPVYLYKCEVTNNAVTAATIPTLSFAATAIAKTEGLCPVVESAAGKIILRSRKALSDLTGTLILLS